MKQEITITLGIIFALAACASAVGQSEQSHLTDVGMFYVGGGIKPGATQHTEQALVHYFKSDAISRTPVIMYPGLGLSSYIYISTPDGRQGWAQQFAKSGHAAYVYDPVNTGPSGLPADAFRGETPASVSTWNINQIWPRWGFGDSRDQPYENVRFPVENVEQFYASWPARLASGGMGGGGGGMAAAPADGEAPPAMGMGMGQAPVDGAAPAMGMGRMPAEGDTSAPADGAEAPAMGGGQQRGGSGSDIAALVALLEKTGPAVLMPHSMGGTTVFQVANERPDLVKGIVVIEPVGCPRSADQIAGWGSKVPFLAVYGDYVDSRGQTGRRDACRETARMANEAGGNGAMLELTEDGVFGNTHLMMQDNNSADIGVRIIEWIQTNVD
jgi:pimeloyl-ACP methyl ester carboxylesterase